jgi:hypothetical protein
VYFAKQEKKVAGISVAASNTSGTRKKIKNYKT